MKLSDIKGERAIEVVADLIEPVANIAADKGIAALFAKEKLAEGADPREAAIKRLKSAVPQLLKSHKSDIISILAAIDGVEREQYAKELSLPKLLNGVMDLLNDEEFKTLFLSAQSGQASGSVSVNTEAPNR